MIADVRKAAMPASEEMFDGQPADLRVVRSDAVELRALIEPDHRNIAVAERIEGGLGKILAEVDHDAIDGAFAEDGWQRFQVGRTKLGNVIADQAQTKFLTRHLHAKEQFLG